MPYPVAVSLSRAFQVCLALESYCIVLDPHNLRTAPYSTVKADAHTFGFISCVRSQLHGVSLIDGDRDGSAERSRCVRCDLGLGLRVPKAQRLRVSSKLPSETSRISLSLCVPRNCLGIVDNVIGVPPLESLSNLEWLVCTCTMRCPSESEIPLSQTWVDILRLRERLSDESVNKTSIQFTGRTTHLRVRSECVE